MRVLVVVLNWNGVDDTMDCLDALSQQTHAHADVLVIDNGSAGDDVARLRARAAGGTFLLHEEPENLGFAGGVNVGIRRGLREGYDAIALLNNDAVPEPEWLAALVAAIDREDASIATGLLLRESDDPALRGTIDTAGDELSIWGMPFPRGRGLPREQAPPAGRVFSASGGASLFRSSLFREIGAFDEQFFAYFEDVDVGFRARLAGHEIVYDPAALAFHRIGATSGRIPGFTVRQTFKNLPLLLVKNVPRGLRYRIFPRFALLLTMMLAKSIVTGGGRHSIAGLRQAFRLVRGHGRRERRLIQGGRVASTADIDALLVHDLPPEQAGMRRLLRPFRGRAT
ncbi:glycosyltransferase family 2 protein [Microbacterium amylolyticum]|uniref:GT2 family glycosyltransferase n=1 Tax=Microbacterium amylolyticum TaxID=936337 RepID=A0ABS4ZHM1_9MICO|nr:glycosyltransferase family 2 protein [Microbacterium amylolyticum]MBP2436508.1 GT2 family glycosyltransferase [Microbacterium amylolyticum]